MERVFTKYVLIFACFIFAIFAKKSIAEDSNILNLEQFMEASPVEYEATAILSRITSVAKIGILRSPFVPTGVVIQEDMVTNSIVERQSLCFSLIGKSVLYDQDTSGANIFAVKATADVECRIDLERVNLGQYSLSLPLVVRDHKVEKRLATLVKNGDSLDVAVYSNNLGEILEAWFYSSLAPSGGTGLLKFAPINSRNGDSRSLKAIYNFTLEKALTFD